MLVAVALRSLSTFFIVLGAVLAALHIFFAGQPKPADLLDAIVDVVKSSMGFAKAFTGSCADEIPPLGPHVHEDAAVEEKPLEDLDEDDVDEFFPQNAGSALYPTGTKLPETDTPSVPVQVVKEDSASEDEEEESEEEDD